MAVSEGIVIDAGRSGKIKTLSGTLGMLGLLLHYPYLINFFGITRVIIDFHVVGLWITYVSVVFSITSGAGYLRGFFSAMRQRSPT